ncbi:AMP phosphorylase [Candidatus Pacearchaeota archaeon]|nr:AMP phosphorylase [Candidatus Pacearchaeota archaeon]
MRLQLRNISLGAGRPVAFLHEDDAKELNVHPGERIEIVYHSGKIIAIVDVVKGFIKVHEISLSDDITHLLKIKARDFVHVSLAHEPKSAHFIAKKVQGKVLNRDEIFSIIRDIIDNSLTETEIAYFISAVYEHGMNWQETLHLTEAIYQTGTILSWKQSLVADKHCIGGIPGNRTTPIVVPICAAAELIIPKTSSRAITSAAGTADVIETLSPVDFPASELQKIVKSVGACLAWGGSLGLAPADDKIIRIERILNIDPESQLLASIFAKKLAVGSKYVLIDIPYGFGAKVTLAEGNKLKKKFIALGKHFRVKVEVLLTLGDQPIGNGIGPILEMIDVLKVLKQDHPPADLESKSLVVAGRLLEMVGKAKKGQGRSMAQQILRSGQAFEKFKEIIEAQGGSIKDLQPAPYAKTIYAPKPGKIKSIDNKLINSIAKVLGCPVDKGSGIYLYKHKNEKFAHGTPLLTLYSASAEKLREGFMLYHLVNPIVVS